MAELYLGTDDRLSSIQKIAGIGSFTAPGEYTKYSTQRSRTIYLEAGKRYFIETVHIDDVRDDHLSVGWRLPNGTMQAPIPGRHLIPYVPQAKTSIAANTKNQMMMKEGSRNPYATVKANFIDLAPNPVQSAATIRFAVTETAHTVVELYDAQGALAGRLFNTVAQTGNVYQVTLNAGNLANGVYYVRLVTNGNILQKQVVIAH
jgi:hypothetical protein